MHSSFPIFYRYLSSEYLPTNINFKPIFFRSSSSRNHHRRTPSNSSTSAFPPGSVHNPGYEEHNLGYVVPGGGVVVPHSDYHHVAATPTRKYSRQNSSYTSPVSLVDLERPQTLEIPLTPRTPLRSSLRKNSSYSNRYAMGGGGSSGGTPTNPTPPDSLYDDTSGGGGVVPPPLGTTRSDSGFVSTTTSNRVRFSPSPFDKTGAYVTDWSPTHELSPGHQPPQPLGSTAHRAAHGPNPAGGPAAPGSTTITSTKSPFPMQRHNRAQSSNHHYITERDLQRDFNLYQKN